MAGRRQDGGWAAGQKPRKVALGGGARIASPSRPVGIRTPSGPKTDSRPSGDDPHVREGTRI